MLLVILYAGVKHIITIVVGEMLSLLRGFVIGLGRCYLYYEVLSLGLGKCYLYYKFLAVLRNVSDFPLF